MSRKIAVMVLLSLGLSVGSGQASELEREALDLVNAHRAAQGCGPLSMQAQLKSAASTQARNMAEHDYFGHESPDGSKFSKRFRAAGYSGGKIAENIAAGYSTAAKVVDVWMNSPKHRKNILDCSFDETGISVFYQEDDQPLPGQSHPMRYYWVQTFGR